MSVNSFDLHIGAHLVFPLMVTKLKLSQQEVQMSVVGPQVLQL